MAEFEENRVYSADEVFYENKLSNHQFEKI